MTRIEVRIVAAVINDEVEGGEKQERLLGYASGLILDGEGAQVSAGKGLRAAFRQAVTNAETAIETIGFYEVAGQLGVRS